EVLVTRVLDPRIDAAGATGSSLDEAIERARARWTDELGKHLEGATSARVLIPVRERREDVAHVLLRTAADEETSLIALATRGTGAVRHALMGSVSLGVLGRSECPVMFVGDNANGVAASDPYHICVTSDGSDSSR